MAGAMIQAIVPTATTETITINYGGIIKNNTWQQASVPLLDGEDVWLNFDSNGGSSVDSISKKLLAGEKTVQFTIPDAKPTLSNAVFKYWTVDGSAKQYKAGDTIDIGENTTLYANWDYKDITLTYYSEDKKTVVGITAIGYDNSKNGYIVKSNNILSGIDKSGYVFVKWETNKGNTLSNGLKISTDEISCYPVYEQKKININFEYNGATGNKTQTNKEVTVNSNYGTLPAPTKSGYSFEGWYLENSFTNKVTSSTIVTNSSEHTLYAKYVDDIDPTAGTVEMKMATSSGKVAYTSGNWSKNDIVVNLKAGSDLGSGHKSTTYTITNSTKGNTVVSNSSSSVTLKEEGIYNIVVTTKDNAGNTATRNYSAKIDKTAPKFTLEKASTSASDTTINYIISDSLSGMAANQKISTKGIRSSTTDISGNNVEYEEFSFGNTAGVLKFTYSLTFNGINTVEKYYKIFVKGTIYDQAGNSTTINMESKVYTYAK
jgi:uncharacterized repeat protein (TIGR02543 family)